MSTGEVIEFDRAAAERRAANLRRATVASDRTSADSHVYFIQIGDSGPIKIGRAIDVHSRLKALQTACPYPLYLRGVVVYGGPRMESHLHRTLRKDRVLGEWFRPSELLLEIVSDFAVVAA